MFGRAPKSGMTGVMLGFERRRGTGLKDWLARRRPAAERRRWHLLTANGFHYFADKLAEWTSPLTKLSWLAAVPSLFGSGCTPFVGLFLTSLTFLVRSAAVHHWATANLRRVSLPIDYDNFGIYARAAGDWRRLREETAPALIGSALASAITLGMALVFRV